MGSNLKYYTDINAYLNYSHTIIQATVGIYEATNQYIDQITAECLSPICAPFEVSQSISANKSILHMSSQLTELQEVDKLLYKTCKRFKGKKVLDVLKIN